MKTSGSPALLLALLACAGGSSIESRPLVEIEPAPADSPVYLFVRAEGLPACPWEVIGFIETEQEDWLEHQDRRDEVSEAVRRMGGQAVLVNERDEVQIQVIRFLDPYSICDPRD
jgi:hypothetical protein